MVLLHKYFCSDDRNRCCLHGRIFLSHLLIWLIIGKSRNLKTCFWEFVVDTNPSEPVCTRSDHRGLWMLEYIVMEVPQTVDELIVFFDIGCPSAHVHPPHQRLRAGIPTGSGALGLASAISRRRSTAAGNCCGTLIGRVANEGQPPPFRNDTFAGKDPTGTCRAWRGERSTTSGGTVARTSRVGLRRINWEPNTTGAKFDRLGGNDTTPGANQFSPPTGRSVLPCV